MLYFFWIMALSAGMMIGTQSAINSRLSAGLGEQPILATLISFVVGTLCLLVLAKLFGQLQAADVVQIPHRPWWQLTGGLLGAFVVFTSVILAPKLGVANMLLLILSGQLISGVLIDHFGWFAMPLRPVTLSKLIGLGLVVLGLLVFFYGEVLLRKIA